MKKQENRWRTAPALWEKLKPVAHRMRYGPTQAEKTLWQRLRKHQVRGLSFRRQFCIGQFIVDFYCARVKLAIEVDGDIHQYQPEKDALRQEFLSGLGIRVMRFPNTTVLLEIDNVIQQIENSVSRTI